MIRVGTIKDHIARNAGPVHGANSFPPARQADGRWLFQPIPREAEAPALSLPGGMTREP